MTALAEILGISALEGECALDVSHDRPYSIIVQNAAQRVIVVPAYADSAAGLWRHECALTRPVTLEFKHERRDGSKYWTQAAGVEHVFVIPDELIHVRPEVTYSFPRLEIGGETITASTSGGTSRGGQGWSDYLGVTVGTLVIREPDWLEALSKVALPLREGTCQP